VSAACGGDACACSQPVPRFYFDVCEGARFIPDEEGLNFDDLNAANARRPQSDGTCYRRGQREVTVEVRNEHGQRVLTAAVSMHIDRVAPPPAAPGGWRARASALLIIRHYGTCVQPHGLV
jgi:hypothetical protein